MPLREHLRELRTRVLLVTAGILVGAVAGWIWYPEVFAVLQDPLLEIEAQQGELVALNFGGVATPLDLQLKLSLFAGVLVTSPWWIYQVWAFVTPGLTRKERRYTVGFLAAAVPLFVAGAVLAWWILPKAVNLLVGLTPEGAVNVIDAQVYLGFIMRIVLAFGVSFLVPVVMVGLNAIGVVTARTLWSGWRWAVLVAFVFAAVATPTADAVSMVALAVPMCALYLGAVGICAITDRRRTAREAIA